MIVFWVSITIQEVCPAYKRNWIIVVLISQILQYNFSLNKQSCWFFLCAWSHFPPPPQKNPLFLLKYYSVIDQFCSSSLEYTKQIFTLRLWVAVELGHLFITKILSKNKSSVMKLNSFWTYPSFYFLLISIKCSIYKYGYMKIVRTCQRVSVVAV